MDVLWCITGGGHFLQESRDLIKSLAGAHKISVAYSRAGLEVARAYGVFDEINKSCWEIIIDSDQGYSTPFTGRFARGAFDLVVVAPCTANTVAKIVHGVADNIVSNVVAMALKHETPVYILPTDYKKTAKSVKPLIVSLNCRNCKPCKPLDECPVNALYCGETRVYVNLLECIACMDCISNCPFNAISFGDEVTVHCRSLDLANTRKLKEVDGVTVFTDPKKILKEIIK